MATISDKRLQHSSDGSLIDYYDADVQTAQEYYSFGSVMPGRTYSAGKGYRYGFNGKENDNEVKKDGYGNPNIGTQQDYGMRINDTRLGRFLSVDPIGKEYPALSSYQFASNSPIAGVDRDGLEIEPYQSMRAEQSIRSYEVDLHKKDPGIIIALSVKKVSRNNSFEKYACRRNFDGG